MKNKFAKLFDFNGGLLEGKTLEGQILVTIAHDDESSLITLNSSIGQQEETLVEYVRFNCDESEHEDNPYHEAIEYFENLSAYEAYKLFG